MTRWSRAALTAPAAILLVTLLATPPALAADSHFDLDVALPVTIEGDRTLTSDRGALYLHGDAGQATLLLTGADATLTRVIHRAYPIVDTRDPELQWRQEVSTEELPLDGGSLRLDERREGFQLLLWDSDLALAHGAHGGPLHVGALDQVKTVRNELQEPLRLTLLDTESLPFKKVLRAGLYQGHATDGRVTAHDFKLFIGDATATYFPQTGESLDLPAHFRVEKQPGTLYDPVERQWVGVGEHTEYVHEYLLLEGTGLLQMQFAGVPVQTFSPQATIAVDGEAFLPGATGGVAVDTDTGSQHHDLHGEDLTLAGRFTLHMDRMAHDRAHTRIQGTGDVTHIAYGAQSHDYPWATVAAVGIGTLILGALAWAWANGKLALGGAGGLLAGYARVQGQDVLDHPGRIEVYTLVQANPGASFHDLEAKVTFGASSLNYHLRVLERNQFVTRVKDGRYVRFFDRQSGTYSRHRKDAACALRNEQTAEIAAFIAERPGVAQCEIAARFQIAASTVSWHIRRLQQNGLVHMQRDNHYTRYYLGDAWGSLPVEEQRRFGVAAAVPV